MLHAVSGTSLASCGQSIDDSIAATISTMMASENAGAAPKRALRMPTSRNCPTKVIAICDNGRYSAHTTQARIASTGRRTSQPQP